MNTRAIVITIVLLLLIGVVLTIVLLSKKYDATTTQGNRIHGYNFSVAAHGGTTGIKVNAYSEEECERACDKYNCDTYNFTPSSLISKCMVYQNVGTGPEHCVYKVNDPNAYFYDKNMDQKKINDYRQCSQCRTFGPNTGKYRCTATGERACCPVNENGDILVQQYVRVSYTGPTGSNEYPVCAPAKGAGFRTPKQLKESALCCINNPYFSTFDRCKQETGKNDCKDYGPTGAQRKYPEDYFQSMCSTGNGKVAFDSGTLDYPQFSACSSKDLGDDCSYTFKDLSGKQYSTSGKCKVTNCFFGSLGSSPLEPIQEGLQGKRCVTDSNLCTPPVIKFSEDGTCNNIDCTFIH